MGSLVLEIEDYPLPAGVAVPISREGTYFLLMTGSNVDVELSYKGSRIGGGPGLQGGDGVGPLKQKYDQVTLTSSVDQTVKVATSSDPVTITRLSGNVNSKPAPLNDYQGITALTFDGVNPQSISANTARALIEAVADSANAGKIYIGSTDATAGIPLSANGTWSNYVNGAIDVFGDTNGDVLHLAEGLI